jgi:hypothetical protein
MIRLTLVDHEGNAMTPQELLTEEDLREAAERARALIRECERMARLKSQKKAGTGVPYL